MHSANFHVIYEISRGLTRGRGMTESIRHQWVCRMHHCALHEAMSRLTNRYHLTNIQHVDLGKSRSTQDTKDMVKLLEWFDQHDPVYFEVSPLSSGLTATDEDMVNCDQAEEADEKIQKSLDSVVVTSAKIKKIGPWSNSSKTGIKVDKNNIHIEPSVLFICCTGLAQRQSKDLVTLNHTNITL